MEWLTGWSHIEIEAENEEDETFLRQLLEKLPKKAKIFYTDGNLEEAENTNQKLSIVFNR